MTYDPTQDLVGEARLFAKDKTLGRRTISIVERLADALEAATDGTGKGPVS